MDDKKSMTPIKQFYKHKLINYFHGMLEQQIRDDLPRFLQNLAANEESFTNDNGELAFVEREPTEKERIDMFAVMNHMTDNMSYGARNILVRIVTEVNE